MKYIERADNVYLIDTKMFSFDNYCACYLVEGKEIALIDTGLPNRYEALRSGVQKQGFSVSDISYVFITHGHTDHCGNVAALLKENPRAKVFTHPLSAQRLTDPAAETSRLKGLLLPKMLSRFGEMEPVTLSRLHFFNDGDVFDLGNGERLRIIFAPGHQPDGVVIFEEKNHGIFINDLVGVYLADADASLILTPYDSDVVQAMESLRKLAVLTAKRFFLGHYGISNNPEEVIHRALKGMQQLLDIGADCVARNKPKEIESMVTASKMPIAKKLLQTRGEIFYNYLVEELIPHQSVYFSEYYSNPMRGIQV